MFLLPVLDQPLAPPPIVSSLVKSRAEKMGVAGPGPQWVGDFLRDVPAAECFVEVARLPYLSVRRPNTAAPTPGSSFQLAAESPVVIGVATALFPDARPLRGLEYEALSELADRLALTQTQSLIPGMR